uniref:Voltage-dependent T-type calcium channel subunit alpha n=1 Tax=Equus asinus asinus TaxID=83772 RepID=A0A8C4LLD1_EQUAS
MAESSSPPSSSAAAAAPAEAEPGVTEQPGPQSPPPSPPGLEEPLDGADPDVPHPDLAPVAFFCLRQTTSPRNWCIKMVCNPYPFMLVILLNCVTLGMYQPCDDMDCLSERCKILQVFDDFIFVFFAMEMVLKMVALGIFGKKCYLGDTWNRLDFFIVMAGMVEYSLDLQNINLSAIRTVRVLRPLKAINRVPSMRILVNLLLDTLPMLGNVLLLCFFVFFIFGIIGVQLWAGLLRNRCFLEENFTIQGDVALPPYYQPEEDDEMPFICSLSGDNGIMGCHEIPPLKEQGRECCLSKDDVYDFGAGRQDLNASGLCVNWNRYYNVCRTGSANPHKGAINFDNIGYAWIVIFQVITLEGWVEIMYYVMDAHSFYNFIYFILLIIVGSFFMINLCLVVIATQFSETKQREHRLMLEQRQRYLSSSTVASYAEPGDCYEEIFQYVCHILRKAKRRALGLYQALQSRRQAPGLGAPTSAKLGPHAKEPRHHSKWPSPAPLHASVSLSVRRGGGPRTEGVSHPGPCSAVLGIRDSWEAHWRIHAQSCRPPASGRQPSRPGLGGGSRWPWAGPARGRGSWGLGTALILPSACFSELCPGHSPQDLTPHALVQPISAMLASDPASCPRCQCEAGQRPSGQEGSGSGDSEGGEAEADGDGAQSSEDGASSGLGKEDEEEPADGAARLCGDVWREMRAKLRGIVDSKYFSRGIMMAILVNTVSMGIEHHEQPEELTNILEICNVVFTSMFALEMLLKLAAFGLFDYLRNPYNIFDSIIVIISIWEIVGQADGGLSVLRTFRLLRVLKLVRFMPALRRQLVVLMKTMDNVATFCMLLMLFIFIFSILGMHIFGCKFSLRTDTGDTVPDRKNFDSLLWAIVTVFQILTQEDWNVVLYNGMASTSPWASLYFVALMTFGNYVLFNLLVAILVEGFQAEVTVALVEEAPPRGLHKTGWGAGVLGGGGLQFKHLAGNRSPKDGSSSRSSYYGPWGRSGAWASRRSSWNSLKHRPPSAEHESLLSGERGGGARACEGAREEGPPRAAPPHAHHALHSAHPAHRHRHHRRTLSLDTRDSVDLAEQVPSVGAHPRTAWRAAGAVTGHEDCNGRMPNIGRRPQMGTLSRSEVTTCCVARGEEQGQLPLGHPGPHVSWALCLPPGRGEGQTHTHVAPCPPLPRFRVLCQTIIAHKLFDYVVLAFIFLNCITIALERPQIEAGSTVSGCIRLTPPIAPPQVVSLGLYFGEEAYLRSSWNVLDGFLVFVSIIDIVVSVASAGGAKILGVLRVLRLLRTLRPLRVISRAPGLKLVVETLISSLKPIGNIVLICCAFFIIFGILGVQLFKGKFYHCLGVDTRNITNRSDCVAANYRWVHHKYNFDNLGQALMSLFVLASKDGWVNIMYNGLDAVAVDQQPVPNHNPWMLLYFISFLLIVSFFVLNMFVGVVVENFHKCRQHQEAEEARRREEKRLRRLEKKRRKAQRLPYYATYCPTRLLIHSMCTSHYLDIFITFIICLNVVTMSLEHYNQPTVSLTALKYCNYMFTTVFVLEAVLKLVAFGLRRFFKDRWNQLDLAIVLLSVMGITLEEIEINAALPINPTIIRIMRVLRIARVLKLLKMATGMRALLDTVVQALPQVGNLGLLFMLLFFIYAALGVELFGKLVCNDENPCEGMSRHATFENFGMAFLTLFQVSTGDNWNGIMKDTLRDCTQDERGCLSSLQFVSPLYFVSFVLTAQFVLINVVVAVLMKHLDDSNKEAQEDAEMDAELELEMAHSLGPSPRPATSSPGAPGQGPAGVAGGAEAEGPAQPLRSPPPVLTPRHPQWSSPDTASAYRAPGLAGPWGCQDRVTKHRERVPCAGYQAASCSRHGLSTPEAGIWAPSLSLVRLAPKAVALPVPALPGATGVAPPPPAQWELTLRAALRGLPAQLLPSSLCFLPAAPPSPFSPDASSPLLPMPAEFFHPAVSASQKAQEKGTGAGSLPKIALQGSWASLRSPSVNCTLLRQVGPLPGSESAPSGDS